MSLKVLYEDNHIIAVLKVAGDLVQADKTEDETLADKVKAVKSSDFDMVPVAVKGKVSQKPEGQEGWDEILTITEIVIVGSKPSKIDVKIEEKK